MFSIKLEWSKNVKELLQSSECGCILGERALN